MSNNFYNPSGTPTTRAAGSSANVRAEFAAIGTAFDKLPALTANAYKVAYVNSAGNGLTAASDVYIDASGYLSVGNVSAGAHLFRVSGGTAAVLVDYEGNDSSGVRMKMLKGRGTGNELQANDDIGSVDAIAKDSTNAVDTVARIQFEADLIHTPTSKPSKITLSTTPAGAVAFVSALRIDSNQDVTVISGNLLVSSSGKAGLGRTAPLTHAAEVKDAIGVFGNTISSNAALYFGRVSSTANDAVIGFSGGANQFAVGSVQNDLVILASPANSVFVGGSLATPAVKIDASGNLSVLKAGGGINVSESGGAAKMGLATLVAGTAVVTTSAIAATSRVFLTSQTTGASPGTPRVSARNAGVNFTITSTSGGDTSQVAWIIYTPS